MWVKAEARDGYVRTFARCRLGVWSDVRCTITYTTSVQVRRYLLRWPVGPPRPGKGRVPVPWYFVPLCLTRVWRTAAVPLRGCQRFESVAFGGLLTVALVSTAGAWRATWAFLCRGHALASIQHLELRRGDLGVSGPIANALSQLHGRNTVLYVSEWSTMQRLQTLPASRL